MSKRNTILLWVAIALSLFLLFPKIESYFQSKINSLEKNSGEFFTAILPKKILNPAPLRFGGLPTASNLTRAGVFQYTNAERKTAGLHSLVFDAKLNSVAEHKAQDIFDKQYFAHISPQGIGAAELAKAQGYDYIIIGENLALGNFKDDKELVAAWMASPGHRANILTKRYEDIGIAVKKGQFEGKSVWIAVQTFGVPASSCISVDATLKQKIDENKARLTVLEADLKTKKAGIDAMEPKRGKDYNIKVEAYNATVNEYNALANNTKAIVGEYNTQVKTYNACAEGV